MSRYTLTELYQKEARVNTYLCIIEMNMYNRDEYV